jgi:hypothetical protein
VGTVLENLQQFYQSTPHTKVLGHVVRRYRLVPKYGLGDLPQAKGSPTVVCPKANIFLAGFQRRDTKCLNCPSTGSDGVSMTFSHDRRAETAYFGVSTQRTSVSHRHELRGHCGFIANDDAEYLGDVAAIALIAVTAVMRSRRTSRSR